MTKTKIADKLIGEKEPCFIIAEAGVNHNGDISLAKKLIDVARTAGADAVKFQIFQAERLVTAKAQKAPYQKETTGTHQSQFEMLKSLELSKRGFKELFNYSSKKGIIFLATPFDRDSADFLDKLGVPAFKVGSGEVTNLPFLKHIAGKMKPVILSTGMSTLAEVKEALDVIKKTGVKEIVLLHCVTSYPARIESTNLKAMQTLRDTFNLPVGFSDHSVGITIPIAAAALGACVIEKHFTLDKNLPGPDHRASLEPEELKQMITAVRDIEKALGNGVKRPTKDEEENKKVGRRSIVARVDIPGGTVITEDMLDIKRPGTGLEPKYLGQIIGKVAGVKIKQDELVTWKALQ